MAWLWAWLAGPLVARLGGPWRGRCFIGAGAGGWQADVSAGCGAREQEALQRGGTQEAAVQVGEDGGEVGGAEACRDGGECGGGGALADGGEEVAAVAAQDADGVEEDGDVLGHGRGFAGLILGWIGWGGWTGYDVAFCHVSIYNTYWQTKQCLLSARRMGCSSADD